jgi:hypothetical protein
MSYKYRTAANVPDVSYRSQSQQQMCLQLVSEEKYSEMSAQHSAVAILFQTVGPAYLKTRGRYSAFELAARSFERRQQTVDESCRFA